MHVLQQTGVGRPVYPPVAHALQKSLKDQENQSAEMILSLASLKNLDNYRRKNKQNYYEAETAWTPSKDFLLFPNPNNRKKAVHGKTVS